MVDIISDLSLVLVCVLPNPRDLEIARLLGWYRIPLRKAPKVIAADYLAFYQTGSFGPDQRWRVETAAEVRGHELVRRAELLRDEPDHPRAQEEYYKISLGPLLSLDRPIQAGKWKRFTFLYTTGALLKRAETLNDLVVRTDDRDLLWHQLRERALQGGQYRADELPEQALDPAILALLGSLQF